MADLEDLVEQHFRELEAHALGPGGRYLRPVLLGSARFVLAAAVEDAYDQGRLDAALVIREREWPGVRSGLRRAFGSLRP